MEKLKAIATVIHQKNKKAIEGFYLDLSQYSSPNSAFKISIKSQKNLLKKPSLNSTSNVLTDNKMNLLCELRSLDAELKKAQNEGLANTSASKKKIQECIDFQALQKANDLITRMNQQRRQMEERRKKKEEQLHISVQKSLKKLQIYKEENQKVKEGKKKQIQVRINHRQERIKIQELYYRKSNPLRTQVQHRVSLPYLNSLKNKESSENASQLLRHKNSMVFENEERRELKQRKQLYQKQYKKKNFSKYFNTWGESEKNI